MFESTQQNSQYHNVLASMGGDSKIYTPHAKQYKKIKNKRHKDYPKIITFSIFIFFIIFFIIYLLILGAGRKSANRPSPQSKNCRLETPRRVFAEQSATGSAMVTIRPVCPASLITKHTAQVSMSCISCKKRLYLYFFANLRIFKKKEN